MAGPPLIAISQPFISTVARGYRLRSAVGECQLAFRLPAVLDRPRRDATGGGCGCGPGVIGADSEFVHFGRIPACDCTVNYRLWWGCRRATLYSSGQVLRRVAGIGTSCCPSVAAGSLLDTTTSTHGGRSVAGIIIMKSIECHFGSTTQNGQAHHELGVVVVPRPMSNEKG